MIPQNYRCTTACTHLLPVYLQTAGFSRVVPCMMHRCRSFEGLLRLPHGQLAPVPVSSTHRQLWQLAPAAGQQCKFTRQLSCCLQAQAAAPSG